MKILMMGTGPFAVPTLRALHDSPHNVAAVFTRPDKATSSRRKASPPNPMRSLAEELALPVYDPADVDSSEAHATIRELAPDLLIVCDYGQILASETLKLAAFGGFNLHASLLPKYRGAAPVHWAIFHGETETGNTVIHMTSKLDAGPCVAQERIAIDPDESADVLEKRLAGSGAKLVLQTITALESDRLEEIPQDASQVSRAPKLRKTDGQVDWTRSAEQIRNQVRALKPWPTTYTYWLRADREPLRLILDEVRVGAAADAEPGIVMTADAHRLTIATGCGELIIERVQPAGKRVMSAEEFLCGHRINPGDRLGNPSNGS